MRSIIVKLAVFLAAAIAPALSFSETSAKTDSSEKLRCMLFISQQSSTQDWWYKIPRNSSPHVGQTRKLVIGQDFSVFPFVENAAVKDGKFKLKYSIYLVSPDGKRKTMVDNALFEGKKELVSVVQACPDVLMGTVSSADFKPGKYFMKMILLDEISGKTAETETWFDVAEWSEPTPMKDTKIVNEYIKNYYLQPSPETLWSIFFSDDLNLEQKNAPNGLNYIFIGFLRAAFQQNQFLEPKLAEKFEKAKPVDRAKIIFLAAIMNNPPLPEQKLRDYEIKYQDAIRKAIPKDPHKSWDAVLGAAQLDMLWGEFFANGTYAPIRRMMDALSFYKEAKAAEEMLAQRRKPASPLEWDNLFFGMLYKASMMTLAQNSYDIDLVRKYCIYALEHGDIPKAAVKDMTPIIKQEFEEVKEEGKK